MRDLIFVSLEDWDAIWRRNQFVCAELARRGYRILFVGLPRNVSHDLRKGRIGELFRQGTYFVDSLAGVTVTHPLKWFPDTLALGRWLNEWVFRGQVKTAAKRLGFQDPLLWLNPHSAVHMVGQMGKSGVIYDVTDDWISLSQSSSLRNRIEQQDAALCGRANAVIVCSQRLLEMKQKLARSVHLIPNGVEVGHYEGVMDQVAPLPGEAGQWAKPVFGYTGTCHPDRVNVELVRELSEKLAEAGKGSLVFVGPNHLSREALQRLESRGNVFFVGPVAYQKIPEYMRAFDVCIVPHCMSAFTESLNPIKLFEYLAAGKPIVATDVAGFRDFPELVRVASNADEFFTEMQLALAEGDLKSAARKAEAERHSWVSRVDEIEKVLESIGVVSGQGIAAE